MGARPSVIPRPVPLHKTIFIFRISLLHLTWQWVRYEIVSDDVHERIREGLQGNRGGFQQTR